MIGIEENYMALYVAIMARKTPDAAFRLMAGDKTRQNIEWTDEMFIQMAAMRKSGRIWEEVGAEFGVKAKTAHRAYTRWKEQQCMR